MANRNFSMVEYFKRVAEDHVPELTFRGKTKSEWRAWNKKAARKLLELLGEFPEPAPLRAEVVASVEENGIVKERVIFDSEAEMSVPCILCRPKDIKRNRKNAAIVCSHGHGPFGKLPVAGVATHPELRQNIAQHNYNYGELMAQRGFVTLCPDLRVFGERCDGDYGQRDPCNVHFIRGAILGIYTLTLNIFDLMRCADYLQTRREIDPERIGLMGLSQGGTMATFGGAVDQRFKAVDIICYLNSWRDFGIRTANFCGSQIVPNIFRYFDTHDVAGLIAPRPLLVEMSMWETGFPIDDTIKSVKPLERLYKAAGVPENLDFEIHSYEHAFGMNKAYDFFGANL